MTPALMWVSGFYKDGHEIKYIVEPSFRFDFKSLLKIFKKDRIFEFLFLTPMPFFLINNKLIIRLSLKMERHCILVLNFWIGFFSI